MTLHDIFLLVTAFGALFIFLGLCIFVLDYVVVPLLDFIDRIKARGRG